MKNTDYLTDEQLQRMCIEYSFFTCGDNKEYQELMDMNNNNASMLELASKIEKHSDQDKDTIIKAMHTAY